MTSTLAVEELADRVVVTLSRPERRNAIDAAMIRELHDVCAGLEERPRLLLLTGADGVFAAGADIGELRERGRDQALNGINSRLFDRIARLPMPTVAAATSSNAYEFAKANSKSPRNVATIAVGNANGTARLSVAKPTSGCNSDDVT